MEARARRPHWFQVNNHYPPPPRPFPQVAKKARFNKKLNWESEGKTLRTAVGMSPTEKPWTSRAGTKLRGVPSNGRVREMIDIAWFASTAGISDSAEIHRIQQTLKVDVSQSLHRRSWSTNIATFTTTSEVYSFAHDRMISEREKFFFARLPTGGHAF